MAPRKPPSKATKPSRRGKSLAKPAKTKSGKSSKAAVKSKAKRLVKSAAKTLILKSNMKRKSPSRPAKTPKRKPAAKKPAPSPRRPVAKSPARKSAKSPGKTTAKSPVKKPTKSPGKTTAKSPVKKPTKSPGRLAKSSINARGRPGKSPGRPSLVKLEKKSPGRPKLKSPSRSPKRSPSKLLKKSPNRPVKKTPTRSFKRSPSKSPKKSPSKPMRKSPGRPPKKSTKLISEAHPRIRTTVVKKKSPCGRTAVRIPDKVHVQASRQKSPMKASQKTGTPVVNSSLTLKLPATKSPTPSKMNKSAVSLKKVIVVSSPSSSSQTKPSHSIKILQSVPLSPRKRGHPGPAAPSPPKKIKAVVTSTASTPKPPFVSPPRPSRVISPPVRLLEADARLRSVVVSGKKDLVTKLSPILKSPPKPTRVIVLAEKRQSRSETREAEKSEVRTTRRTVTAQTGDQKKPSLEKYPIKKTTPKVVHKEIVTKSMKDDAQKPDKRISSKSTSHPCKHCGLIFRSHSDGERHEQRCTKNPSRTETRYQCNKCSGNFTMSDLILHKKQAHPQRDQVHLDVIEIEPESFSMKAVQGKALGSQLPACVTGEKSGDTAKSKQSAPVQTDIAVKKGAKSPQKAPPGGLVLKVPVGGNLNDVIRQAVQAATDAGLIQANKKIVISGQNVKSSLVNTDAAKQKMTRKGDASLKRKPQESSVDKTPSSAKRVRFEKLPVHVEYPSPAAKELPEQKISHKEKRTSRVHSVTMPGVDSDSSQSRLFTCLDCGEIFPSRKRVSEHKGECPCVGKTSVYACMDCNTTFVSRLKLNAHRRATHSVLKSKTKSSNMTIRSYKCSECELFFPIEGETKRHITEIHGGVGESSMCNVVATPDALPSGDWNRNISEEMVEEVIKNIVNGARKDQPPNSSEDAGKSSTDPVSSTQNPETEPNLSAEMDILEEENIPEDANASPESDMALGNAGYNGERKPGQCLDCFMKVSSRLELAKHKRNCQIAIQNRQLFCFVCSSSFRSYFELSRHKQEQHTGSPQNFKCIPCKTVYKTSCEWIEHQNKQHQSSPFRKQPHSQQKATAEKDNSMQKEQHRAAVTAKKSPEKPAKEQNKIAGDEPKPKKNTEQLKTDEVRTRSGRLIHKKKLDDEIIEEVKQKKAKNISEFSNPIGTIEIIPLETDDIIEIHDLTTETTETTATDQVLEPVTTPSSDISVEQQVPDLMNANQGDPPSMISFANGLVAISAEKANNYQIFVDAKEDGSSIQLKLIRKEVVATSSSPSGSIDIPVEALAKPTKDQAAKRTMPLSVEAKAKTSVSLDKSRSIVPASKADTPIETRKEIASIKETTPLPASKKVRRDVPVKIKEKPQKSSSSKAVTNKTSSDKAPITGNPPVDTAGKVVQKGKPFVIGGQTLVPIQFPPGFQLPGGATGGQKVFAIPSTNLPPGLLQLLAKQQKASSAAAASWPPKTDAPQKNITAKPPAAKKTVGILSRASKNMEIPASLKGMTGAQLMARAQARILGRPIQPLAVDAAAILSTTARAPASAKAPPPVKVASPSNIKADLKKNTVTIMPPSRVSATPSGKAVVPSVKAISPVKKSPPQVKKSPPPIKKAPLDKKTPLVKKTSPVKEISVGRVQKMASAQEEAALVKTAIPSKAKEATTVKKATASKASAVLHNTPQSMDARPSLYNDPLYVFQCTSCKKNFKSTAEINKHMHLCTEEVHEVGETAPPVKQQRPTRRRPGTDVWHMKPVVNQKSKAAVGKEVDSQGVEWFVASKSP